MNIFACVLAAAFLVTGCSADETDTDPEAEMQGPLVGLRSHIMHVQDLAAAKEWYTQLLGVAPYFDEPFYVGFDVGGYELGLNPDTANVRPGVGGGIVYWGVADADVALARLLELGAEQIEPVTEVGGGIRHAIVRDPFGNAFGVIENPHFTGGK